MINNKIPWIVIIIGIGFLCLTAWSILRARHETSAITDQDYYTHGLRYNETQLEKKAAETLGWSIDIKLIDNVMQVRLMDRNNEPVTAANGFIVIFSNNKSNRDRLPFLETKEGVYELTLEGNFKGSLHAQLEFERNGARLNKQLLLNH